MQLQAGRLLVASPALVDPNFARAIVLLLDVNAEGALGVVLNHPLETPVGEVLKPWADAVGAPGVLFQGGPVETEAALALAAVEGEAEPLGWQRMFANFGLVDLDTPSELLVGAVSSMRIFAGYSGWGAGQLEGEIEEGSWYVVPAEPEDAFEDRPELLWEMVLRRQQGPLSMLVTMPVDPGLN